MEDERDTTFVLVLVLDDQSTVFVDGCLVVEVAAEDDVESLGELLVVEEGFFLLDEGSEIHVQLLVIGMVYISHIGTPGYHEKVDPARRNG